MTKKLLCVVALILAFVCVFASCGELTNNSGTLSTLENSSNIPENSSNIPENSSNIPENSSNTLENSTHTHSYGEWEIIKEATYTEKGSKERVCTCGEKETIDIPKIEEVSKALTSLECYYEIESYLNALKKLNSVSYVEDPYVDTIYFDGQQTLIHTFGAKEGSSEEAWYGKVGSQYIEAITSTSYDGSSNKYYKEISEEEFNEQLDDLKRTMFEHIEDLLYVIEDGENFECLKITSEEKITYVIKSYVWGDTYTFKTEVIDGIITRYELVGEYEVTYPTDIIVTIPDLSSFEKNKT